MRGCQRGAAGISSSSRGWRQTRPSSRQLTRVVQLVAGVGHGRAVDDLWVTGRRLVLKFLLVQRLAGGWRRACWRRAVPTSAARRAGPRTNPACLGVSGALGVCIDGDEVVRAAVIWYNSYDIKQLLPCFRVVSSEGSGPTQVARCTARCHGERMFETTVNVRSKRYKLAVPAERQYVYRRCRPPPSVGDSLPQCEKG